LRDLLPTDVNLNFICTGYIVFLEFLFENCIPTHVNAPLDDDDDETDNNVMMMMMKQITM
jgi:hypothetical protein